jgi:hypothetical protein
VRLGRLTLLCGLLLMLLPWLSLCCSIRSHCMIFLLVVELLAASLIACPRSQACSRGLPEG